MLENVITKSITKSNIENFRKGYNNLESFSQKVTHLPCEDLFDKINILIEKKIAFLGEQAVKNSDVTVIGMILIELKTISENILHFKNRINYKIDDILKDFKLKKKTILVLL